jgi:nicotinamide-nucleotide amidase
LIAATLTEVAGSSDVFECGYVTYSNRAKSEMLGVPAELIARLGAVSAEVAQAMADGALAKSGADVAIAVTGVAGPGGGSAEKPVGLVFLGIGRRHATCRVERHLFAGDRNAVRMAAVSLAIKLPIEAE